MKLESTIRDLQDKARNRGWRIQWIPWQQTGRPEYIHNSPLTILMILIGIGLFFAGIILMAKLTEVPNFLQLPDTNPIWIGVGTSALGILTLIISRVVAAYQKQSSWIGVEASCLDRDFAEGTRRLNHRQHTTFWAYRLLCTFNYNGRGYEVTPECSKVVTFNSRKDVEKYLESKITLDGKCLLYIDPKNPLHAVFDEKQKI